MSNETFHEIRDKTASALQMIKDSLGNDDEIMKFPELNLLGKPRLKFIFLDSHLRICLTCVFESMEIYHFVLVEKLVRFGLILAE